MKNSKILQKLLNLISFPMALLFFAIEKQTFQFNTTFRSSEQRVITSDVTSETVKSHLKPCFFYGFGIKNDNSKVDWERTPLPIILHLRFKSCPNFLVTLGVSTHCVNHFCYNFLIFVKVLWTYNQCRTSNMKSRISISININLWNKKIIPTQTRPSIWTSKNVNLGGTRYKIHYFKKNVPLSKNIRSEHSPITYRSEWI